VIFREVVAADFEFETAVPGQRPKPVSVVARELLSGRRFRIFVDDGGGFPARPPWATGPDVLFVSYFASAELGCYRVLNWPMPENILDLYVEFRNLTNNLPLTAGRDLLGALAHFGLQGIGAAYKNEIRDELGNGTYRGRYSREEILDYNETDVDAIDRLLPKMLSHIDLPRALFRGRYMAAVSYMEHNGIPIDTELLAELREHWDSIKIVLIEEIDKDHGVYENGTFKQTLFAAYLARNKIPWPLLKSGKLNLRDKIFEQQAQTYPAIAPLRELRDTLSKLRLNELKVGPDGRNRCLLSPFGGRSGRNTPSNKHYIFGPARWIRGLIKPPPGYAFFYPDWRAMEFGIAAAKSGCPNMREAYRAYRQVPPSDCYLAFAKLTGAAPQEATAESHPAIRDLYKTCILGVQYGIGSLSLADQIGGPPIVARELMREHRQTFRKFWKWIEMVVDKAMLEGRLQTTMGWTIHTGRNPNPRSLMNYPMQATGSEIMRLAACLMAERGIPIGGVVHDAFAICSPLDKLEEHMAAAEAAMREASRIILNGFELDVEIEEKNIIRWPNRYMDKRGKVVWDKIMALLKRQRKRKHTA
jgi:hypothetical protein